MTPLYWEYSRSQMCHTTSISNRGDPIWFHIRPVNLSPSLITRLRVKDGYQLLRGEDFNDAEVIRNGKTVKELKRWLEDNHWVDNKWVDMK